MMHAMISEDELGDAWNAVLNKTQGLLFKDAWSVAREILTDRFKGHFDEVRVDCGYAENPPDLIARGENVRARVWTNEDGELRYFLFGDWPEHHET